MLLQQTEILKISDALTNEDIEKLTFAADIIRRGGLVVFPTETVYGLGANALDANAAKRIYEAKGRPQNNPLIMHLSDASQIETYCNISGIPALAPLKALMPAPLTVILPAKSIVPRVITAGLDSVAVRVPTHTVARKFIELCATPIAAPSANLSGKPSPTTAKHVAEDMDGRVDIILDGGESTVGLESTIVTLCEEVPTLLRPGGITYEMLSEILGEVHMSHAVLESLKPGETVLSPGMLYKHYAPKTPVELIKGDRQDGILYVNQKAKTQKAAVICYDEDAPFIHADAILKAGSETNQNAYAARLFSLLRDTDSMTLDKVYAFLPRDTSGISLAIYNRLLRAAGFCVKEFMGK